MCIRDRFCAGGDVDWISGDSDRPMPGTSDPSRPIPRSQRKTPGGPFFEVVRQLIKVDKPVIAAIHGAAAVSYTHLRAHETVLDIVCRLLLEKKKK